MYTLYTPFFLYFYNRSFYQKSCTHGEKRGPINNSIMALNSEETYDKLTSRKITQVCDVKRYVGGVVCDPVPHRLYIAQGRVDGHVLVMIQFCLVLNFPKIINIFF